LLTGRMIDVDEAAATGLATIVVAASELQQEAYKIAADLSTHARSTIAATKSMLLRLRDHRRPPAGIADDIIRECYGSNEFKEGVAAFLEGRRPNWK
jgi:enoyl-CoA hydratase